MVPMCFFIGQGGACGLSTRKQRRKKPRLVAWADDCDAFIFSIRPPSRPGREKKLYTQASSEARNKWQSYYFAILTSYDIVKVFFVWHGPFTGCGA